MAKINIVLADSDELFLKQLINYLIGHMGNLDIYSFTTKASMVNFIEDRSNKVDVIVFTEDLMDDSIMSANIPAKIVMGDGSFSTLEGFENVNKYQKAEKFINDILMIFAEKTGHVEAVSTGDKDTKIVGFFSPVGGCGKTSLALATSYALGLQGKRVFYLNVERINSTAALLNEASDGSMSDIYLTAKTKGGNIGLRIIANKFFDSERNFSYINPSESSLEINELTGKEFKNIIESFEKLGEFDVVVVDFDAEFNKDKAQMLSAMDVVFTPFTSDAMSINKMKLLMKEIGMYDELKEFTEKIRPILNKSDNQSISVLQNSGLSDMCSIFANISYSPIFADIENVFHSGDSMIQILSGIIGNV